MGSAGGRRGRQEGYIGSGAIAGPSGGARLIPSPEGGRGLSDDLILAEAERIYAGATERGLVLRFLGALAFRLHCPRFAHLSSTLDRKLTDIDLAAYEAQHALVEALLRDLGYTTHSYVQLAAATSGRSVYWKRELPALKVDIFWNGLRMNHDIDFRNRLELDAPTIPLPELLLEKMQIVEINWKDVKDVIMLLAEHDVGNGGAGREEIDLGYICGLLAQDWGFYYTFTRNLRVVEEKVGELPGLGVEERATVLDRCRRLREAIEAAPKSLAWRMRARIGPRKLWYREVGEMA